MNIVYKNLYPLLLPECLCVHKCLHTHTHTYTHGYVESFSAFNNAYFPSSAFLKYILKSLGIGGFLRISFNSNIIKALAALNVFSKF